MKFHSRLTITVPFVAALGLLGLVGCGGGGGGERESERNSANPPEPTTVALPKTGQTTCFNAAGGSIACGSTGQDGELQTGVAAPSPRFVVAGNGGCLTDNLTGLTWTQNAKLFVTPHPWQSALDLVGQLIDYCGFTDWRLPNRNELRSLINHGVANSAASLSAQGFTNVQDADPDRYWTSTTVAGNTASAWSVHLNYGNVYPFVKSSGYHVWPVRSRLAPFAGVQAPPSDVPETGQTTCFDAAGGGIPCTGGGGGGGQDGALKAGVAWPSPRFVAGSGATVDCVTDNLTGLIWVKTPSATNVDWATALTNANGLTLCGSTDWRLPSIHELQSLVNSGVANQATFLNDQGFSGVAALSYWSSTTGVLFSDTAWLILMSDGMVDTAIKTTGLRAWPVRAGL